MTVRSSMDHSHLSIGEVLSLLQEEFPDVTISKIRFLESQGLLDPERTPSGYRKFYDADIDRLRWILTQQRENFLPLKVIKDRLARRDAGLEEEAEAEAAAPSEAGEPGPGTEGGTGGAGDQPVPIWMADAARHAAARATPELPLFERDPAGSTGDDAPVPSPDPDRPRSPSPGAGKAAKPGERRPSSPLDVGPTSVSLTLAELSSASGLEPAQIDELASYGLVEGRSVGAEVFYDGDALVIAQKAAGFIAHGIEPRHLRMFKLTADREAGFLEQVVLPTLKQRDPAAREKAIATLGELAALGQSLRAALLRHSLRDYLS